MHRGQIDASHFDAGRIESRFDASNRNFDAFSMHRTPLISSLFGNSSEDKMEKLKGWQFSAMADKVSVVVFTIDTKFIYKRSHITIYTNIPISL
jgi:hypothetical protein